ncbi:MAG: hypothetical protein EZS28_001140 [Streblomastix strix]|uniref:Uncharacterized protein n=1 Tax=Streblomastix strix TaxID=222440 RepID=A0A5J4X941_9EUKA|nr:MAG: hypothetical protein EZS28_001140 [Streblomastix strix]
MFLLLRFNAIVSSAPKFENLDINVVLPEPTAPTIQWFPLTRNKEFLVNGLFFGANAIISGPSRSKANPLIIFITIYRPIC